jgi:glycine/D-amino acid oxidase-like deaminating enzyme
MPMRTVSEVVVIGAGFAGAATARALVARGVRRVTVVEAEPTPGQHSSGKNAAIARRVIEDAVLAQLATESLAEIVGLEGGRLFERTGGLLIGLEPEVDKLYRAAKAVPELAAEATVLDRAGMAELVPVLQDTSATHGVFAKGEGIVDIHGLLLVYLDEARRQGAEVALGAKVTGITTHHGKLVAVETTGGRIACGALVNAAGFASNLIAAQAGLDPLPLQPTRRHLFVTAAYPGATREGKRWPFVWDATHGFYFRPEGAGLLMCACDQTPCGAEEPTTDPAVREVLAEKFSRHVPSLREARPAHMWAGIRVLTPDGRFVIGPDPRLQGFHWAAGLGGHGMTTSAGVGRLAAASVVDGCLPAPYAEAFRPGRFLDQG